MRLPKGVRLHGTKYEFRAVVNGRRIVRPLGEDAAEARRLGRLFLEEVRRERREKKPISGTVRDFAEEKWFKDYLPRHRIERDHGKARYRLDTYILPTLGTLQLSEVRRSNLEELRNLVEADGLSVATVRHVLNDARCIFSYAVELEVIPGSPFTGKHIMPTLPKAQPQPLSDLELARILGALGEPYKSAAVFAVRTGCRWGEMRDLCWPDVSFGEKPSILLKHTKNGRWRRVPLDPQAVEVLERWSEQTKGQEFVMPWRPEGPRAAADFTRRCERKVPAWKWKQLRSTAGTRWIREGIPVEVVSRLLGHSNVLITTAHYADISEATVREVFDRVNGRNLGQNLATSLVEIG